MLQIISLYIFIVLKISLFYQYTIALSKNSILLFMKPKKSFYERYTSNFLCCFGHLLLHIYQSGLKIMTFPKYLYRLQGQKLLLMEMPIPNFCSWNCYGDSKGRSRTSAIRSSNLRGLRYSEIFSAILLHISQIIWSLWSSTIEHWILMVFATFACTLGYSFGTFHFFSLDDRVETRIGSATNEFSIACHQDCIQVHFLKD